MVRGLVLAASVLLLAPHAALAQHAPRAARSAAPAAQEPGEKRTRLMLGMDIKQVLTPSDGTSNRFGVGFMWRWRSRTPRPDDRLAFAHRFGSYSSSLSSRMLGQHLEIGDARFRPLMVGVDYKMPRGKWTWSAGLTGGWSVNRLNTAGSFRDRLAAVTGTADVTTDIHNSFAWSPRIKGWYDVNRRVSFMVETYYTHTRPELTIRSGGVDMSRRINADAVVMKAGLVYGIW